VSEAVNGAAADPLGEACERYAQALGRQMNAAGEVVNGFGVLVLVNICNLQVKVLGEQLIAAGMLTSEGLNAALVKEIDALTELVKNKPHIQTAPGALQGGRPQ
jgi:hypothetical protein